MGTVLAASGHDMIFSLPGVPFHSTPGYLLLALRAKIQIQIPRRELALKGSGCTRKGSFGRDGHPAG